MKLVAILTVLVTSTAIARAQAPGQTGPAQTDVEIEDAPDGVAAPNAPGVQPPLSAYDQCIAERRRISFEAAQITDLGERTRRFQSMPQCHRDASDPLTQASPLPQPAQTPVPNPDDLMPSEIAELRSPTTAILLSLGTTAFGYALLLGSDNQSVVTTGAILAFVGPTTGHFYANDYWNAGLGCRLLGTGAAFVGALTLIGSEGGAGTSSVNTGEALFVGGALLYLGGGIYEIATAGQAAREYNRDAAIQRIKLMPMASQHSGGVSLVGSF